ncbi:MAG: ASKHA domain-containing protein, partial [Kiritimatiellia bacterium]|nr:ASKHA domain-containing protein [Kiritimatiellia bacterium]
RREILRRRIVEETLNPLIHALCERTGTASDRILRVAVSGNTVMMHLLLGLSPAGIGRLPFQPVIRRFESQSAAAIGLDLHPNAVLDIVPCISGYVGGDIVSDLAVCRMLDRSGLTLLVDIGTNGEMALWDGQQLRVSAAAAGPAFEGAGIGHGCRAVEGAVDRWRWAGHRADYHSIGDLPPMGLCGSAIIDILAQASEQGFIGETGRLDRDRVRAAGCLWESGSSGGAALVVVPEPESGIGMPLVMTEGDIAEALKAKAAVYAGIRTLLRESGREPEELDRVILAGGFARYLDLDHARQIGLLPDLPPERIEVIGNGSLAGACRMLTDEAIGAEFERILSLARPVELNLAPHFQSDFIDGLMLSPFAPIRR